MKNKINIDVETVRLIYTKYRKHITYGGIIAVSLIVFVFFVLPKILSLSSISEARKLEIQKLQRLKKNLKTINSQDGSLLDSQLQIVSSALPQDKDFEGIINAISIAAGKSGASLDDYDFAVGSIKDAALSVGGYPFLTLVLSIRTNPTQLVEFLDSLAATTPLSEVINIKQSSAVATVTIIFYYKPYVPSNATDDAELPNLSVKEKALLDDMSKWSRTYSEPSFNEAPTGSSSAF